MYPSKNSSRKKITWALYFLGLTVAYGVRFNHTLECHHEDVTLCHDWSNCIPKDHLCDAIKNCDDGSDESRDWCGEQNQCESEDYFPCSQGQGCVRRSLVCDGVVHCHNAADEHICDPAKQCNAEKGKFLCRSKLQCIPLNHVCDGEHHCSDTSDEHYKCDASRRACAMKCQGGGTCQPTPEGPLCICAPGFYLNSDDSSCLDIDECVHPVCEQICINTPGTYECACAKGYTKANNGRCKVNGPRPEINMASGDAIYSIDVDLRLPAKELITNFTGSMAISIVSGPQDKLYWIESKSNIVRMATRKRNGQEKVHVFIDRGLQNPKGMAVDWSTGNIYLADLDSGRIVVCNGNGTACGIVVNRAGLPNSIYIHPSHRKLVWSNLEGSGSIEIANLDGSERSKVISYLGHVNDLVIDPVSSRIIWANSRKRTIESSDLEGNNRKVLVSGKLEHHRPFAIAVVESTLLWVMLTSKATIFSCDIHTGCQDSIVSHTIQNIPKDVITEIYINSPVIYTDKSDITFQSEKCRCSHICLPTRGNNNYKCICPINFLLQPDMHTCKDGASNRKLFLGLPGGILRIPIYEIGSTNNLVQTFSLASRNTPELLHANSEGDRLIYVDLSRKIILLCTTVKSTLRETVLFKTTRKINDIAIDWSTNNIYWIEAGWGLVVGKIVGNVPVKKILALNRNDILLTLDLSNRFIYFVRPMLPSAKFSIHRCFFNAENCTDVLVDNGSPSSMVIDAETRTLYLAFGKADLITSYNLEISSNHEIHWKGVKSTLTNIKMVIDDSLMFWIHPSSSEGLHQMYINAFNSETATLNRFGNFTAIAKTSSEQKSPCQNERTECEQFCFAILQNRKKCACGDGYMSDEERCSKTSPYCKRRCPSYQECYIKDADGQEGCRCKSSSPGGNCAIKPESLQTELREKHKKQAIVIGATCAAVFFVLAVGIVGLVIYCKKNKGLAAKFIPFYPVSQKRNNDSCKSPLKVEFNKEENITYRPFNDDDLAFPICIPNRPTNSTQGPPNPSKLQQDMNGHRRLGGYGRCPTKAESDYRKGTVKTTANNKLLADYEDII